MLCKHPPPPSLQKKGEKRFFLKFACFATLQMKHLRLSLALSSSTRADRRDDL